MKRLALSILAFTFLSSHIFAQYKEAPNGFAFRWTYSKFNVDLTTAADDLGYGSGAELMYVRHLGKFLNLGLPLKVAKIDFPDLDGARSKELFGSFDALLHLKFFKPDRLLYPYLLGGAGVMAEIDNDWKMHPEFPVGAGLNLRLAPHFYLSAQTQYRWNLSDNRDQFQHSAGIWLILGGYEAPEPVVLDADKDGIPDASDQCPNEPGTAALQGCPDGDGDGVVDKFDDCPTEPGLAEMRGCPDKDKDDDGIADDQDRCPDQPGTAATGGCPDRDGDGIQDKNDLCPDHAGPQEYMGCPDTDGDGVVDVHDLCPTTPGPESNKGCPEIKPEDKQVLDFAMKAVQFETGSARLLPESHKILDEIAALLKKYADHKMRINGHTDSIGDADSNQKLSEERAKTCYFYLANKGIAAERLSYKGYGEAQPIGDNRYAEGREKNRRVEFEMYVQSK